VVALDVVAARVRVGPAGPDLHHDLGLEHVDACPEPSPVLLVAGVPEPRRLARAVLDDHVHAGLGEDREGRRHEGHP
jgi:hypothetical protein